MTVVEKVGFVKIAPWIAMIASAVFFVVSAISFNGWGILLGGFVFVLGVKLLDVCDKVIEATSKRIKDKEELRIKQEREMKLLHEKRLKFEAERKRAEKKRANEYEKKLKALTDISRVKKLPYGNVLTSLKVDASKNQINFNGEFVLRNDDFDAISKRQIEVDNLAKKIERLLNDGNIEGCDSLIELIRKMRDE